MITNTALDSPARSTAPDGSQYVIPGAAVLEERWREIRTRIAEARTQGRSIVVVQGLGFVGAAVAAVVAGARDDASQPRYFVVGTDLATQGGYWKIAKINQGLVPIASPDSTLPELVYDSVLTHQNLCATSSEEVYGLADVIVVDLPLDVSDRFIRSHEQVDIHLAPFESAIRAIGSRMQPDALVLVETTVPVGVCEKVALPILEQERAARGIHTPVLLAHAYERVMPGPKYVDSIRNFWRSFSGVNEEARARARVFLSSFVETGSFPLWDLEDTNASELAKVLENSYRAVNIAFIHEWTLLAEKIGVNLFEVIDSIRVRKGTHDNIRQPGFGVGGYCLTKDPLLAQWSATRLFQTDVVLSMTIEALRINQRMPLHTFGLAAELAGGSLSGKRITVLGVSYLPEVADTRNTPTEELCDALHRAGASVLVHDPYLALWPERSGVPFTQDLAQCLAWADGVILAIPHKPYLELTPKHFQLGQCRFVVDAQNGLNDQMAAALHAAKLRLAGVGKGHWRKSGYHH